jgi:hypothetical protein
MILIKGATVTKLEKVTYTAKAHTTGGTEEEHQCYASLRAF